MDWETLRSSCLACTRCELCKTRTNVVFGQGVEDADPLKVGGEFCAEQYALQSAQK